MFIKNIPSIITVSGTPFDCKITGGVECRYLFSRQLVVLDFVPLIGVPSLVPIAFGNSMHCSYCICTPIAVEKATHFFQHSIWSFLSFSTADTFFLCESFSVNVSRRFRCLGGFTLGFRIT